MTSEEKLIRKEKAKKLSETEKISVDYAFIAAEKFSTQEKKE